MERTARTGRPGGGALEYPTRRTPRPPRSPLWSEPRARSRQRPLTPTCTIRSVATARCRALVEHQPRRSTAVREALLVVHPSDADAQHLEGAHPASRLALRETGLVLVPAGQHTRIRWRRLRRRRRRRLRSGPQTRAHGHNTQRRQHPTHSHVRSPSFRFLPLSERRDDRRWRTPTEPRPVKRSSLRRRQFVRRRARGERALRMLNRHVRRSRTASRPTAKGLLTAPTPRASRRPHSRLEAPSPAPAACAVARQPPGAAPVARPRDLEARWSRAGG